MQITCKLCLKVGEGRRSHIYSRLFAKRSRVNVNNKKLLVVIENNNGVVNKFNTEKDVLYENNLFCSECEKLFNPFETYFAKILDHELPTETNGLKLTIIENLDYHNFKMFHLINLFRASVASVSGFQDFGLAKHEDIIRKIILENRDIPETSYPFWSIAIDLNGKIERGLNFSPIVLKEKLFGFRTIQIIYGGFVWMFFVGSHKPSGEITALNFKMNGSLPLFFLTPNEIGTIRENIGGALKSI